MNNKTVREYYIEYRKLHPEQYRKKYNDKYRLRKQQEDPNWRYKEAKRGLSWAKNNRKFLIELLGEKCVRCGFTDGRALQIDHINGGGLKEAKKKGTQSMYLYYKKHPEEALDKLQILCANCNWIKRAETKNETGGRKQVIEIGL